MKNAIIIICIAIISMVACEKEVEKPKAKFHIEVLDTLKGEVVTLSKPYKVYVGQQLKLYPDNDAEFNSFWPGDTVYKDDTLYHYYDENNLTRYHRGESIDSDETFIEYTYKKAGTYNATFISSNAANDGEELKTSTANFTITVE